MKKRKTSEKRINYIREWQKKHPEKSREYMERFIVKKALKIMKRNNTSKLTG